jgi:hypothetical protein
MGEKMFEGGELLKKGRNPRSILRHLSLKRQTEIVARLDDGEALIDLARELTAEGIPTSGQMLSDFDRWFKLREKLWFDADFALELARECKRQGWIRTADEERAAAQVFFNRSVLTGKDPKVWSIVERVNIAKDKVELDREKMILMKREYRERKAKEKKVTAAVAPVSDEEKEAAIRQIYGMAP